MLCFSKQRWSNLRALLLYVICVYHALLKVCAYQCVVRFFVMCSIFSMQFLIGLIDDSDCTYIQLQVDSIIDRVQAGYLDNVLRASYYWA